MAVRAPCHPALPHQFDCVCYRFDARAGVLVGLGLPVSVRKVLLLEVVKRSGAACGTGVGLLMSGPLSDVVVG